MEQVLEPSRRKGPRTKQPKNLVEKRFGKLLVLKRVENYVRPNGKKMSQWLCLCDCGNTIVAARSNLIGLGTTSCGCSRRESAKRLFWRGYESISGTYWRQVKSNAKARALDFTITIEEAWNLFVEQEGKCALSGELLVMDPLHWQNTRLRSSKQTASLDRIDSSLGYVSGNVRWISKTINKMRLNMTDEEFVEECRKVVAHHSQLQQIKNGEIR